MERFETWSRPVKSVKIRWNAKNAVKLDQTRSNSVKTGGTAPLRGLTSGGGRRLSLPPSSTDNATPFACELCAVQWPLLFLSFVRPPLALNPPTDVLCRILVGRTKRGKERNDVPRPDPHPHACGTRLEPRPIAAASPGTSAKKIIHIRRDSNILCSERKRRRLLLRYLQLNSLRRINRLLFCCPKWPRKVLSSQVWSWINNSSSCFEVRVP